MSQFSDDQKPLEDGRKNTLKDVEVSLRDQIVNKLYNKVLDLGLNTKATQAWSMESANIAALLERQQVYLRDLDEFIPSGGEGAFGGSSNLHIPMPHIVSKAYVARFMEAIWGIDPPFTVKARREDGTDKVQMIEDFMRYVVYNWANNYNGLEEALEAWIMEWVNTGTGVMKSRWDSRYTSFVDVVDSQEPGIPTFVIDQNTGLEIAVPTSKLVEREEKKTLNSFQGPVVEPVALEDFVMVGGKGDPEAASLVIHRYWLTASDLWSAVDQKLFNRDAVTTVIDGGGDYESGALNNSIKIQKKLIAGEANLDSQNDLDRYEILECYVKADVDGSGIASDIVLWVSNRTGELLRATYLYRVNPTGETPFSVIHFHKRPGQEHGVGLLEMLHPLSIELDAMHNIRIDFGMLSNNPVGFYRASSSLKPDALQTEPGSLIPLDNPATDIVFPQRPQSTGFFGNEEQVIQSYIERLTGISDLSLGAMSGTQGAARTATGARALLGESNTNLNVHLRHLNRGWRKILRQLFHMMQQRLDGEFSFRITGENGQDVFRKVNSHDLILDIDFDVSSNSANSNKSVQIELAQQMVQIATNPINLQLGITDAGSAYEAYKMLLQAMGLKDFNKVLKKPQGYTYIPTPEEVFNRTMRGEEVKADPRMDVQGIIAYFQTMIDQQTVQKFLSDDQVKIAIITLRQYQQLDQALQQQQAQAVMNQQMQQNAANSQQQAPTGLNPYAGTNPGQLPLQ